VDGESAEEPRRAIVVAGGDPVPAGIAARLPHASVVIAADSGADHAAALGLRVDTVVGDLDSISPAALSAARAAGARVDEHPVEKDSTDLELALDEAMAAGVVEIVVVGGHGGRLDHFLANCATIASPRFAGVHVRALLGTAALYVVRGGEPPLSIDGTPGALFTLIPVHGDARGITITGLRYPLHDEDLPAGTSRGVSNVFEHATATVVLRRGTLVAVVPDFDPQPGDA
jgi:thiamine pyrophosphokinase